MSDSTKLVLIDYEYGMWNPWCYDMGNYLNEWVCDNAHPCAPGVTYYFDNWPTNEEIESLIKQYWLLEKRTIEGDWHWSLDNAECRKAVEQTKACMILNNYYWAVWAVMMLNEEEETNPDGFHWFFLTGRCEMHLKCVE